MGVAKDICSEGELPATPARNATFEDAHSPVDAQTERGDRSLWRFARRCDEQIVERCKPRIGPLLEVLESYKQAHSVWREIAETRDAMADNLGIMPMGMMHHDASVGGCGVNYLRKVTM